MLTRWYSALWGILIGILIRGVYHGEAKNAPREDAWWQRQGQGKERLLEAEYVEPVVEIPP